MDFAEREIKPGIWLDSRRALFLQGPAILAISDLHLGYSWAHRYHGQLLPLQEVDHWPQRLASLCDTYQPRKIIFTGDIVHHAVPVPALQDDFRAIADFASRYELLLLMGNHDRHLPELSAPYGLHPTPCFQADGILLCHGDTAPPKNSAQLTIIGHEHPAISLGDGVATSAKFPCFLLASNLIVLPAFSLWAAGSVFGSYPFLSPLARAATFQTAVAIMGSRLLSLPLIRRPLSSHERPYPVNINILHLNQKPSHSCKAYFMLSSPSAHCSRTD